MSLTMIKNMIKKNKTFTNLLTTIIFHIKNHLRRRVVHTRVPITIYKNIQWQRFYKLSP